MKLKILTFFCLLFLCTFICVSKEVDQPVKRYGIDKFLHNKNYLRAAFTFDEKRILFSSDESGVLNAYSISTHGGNQTQLTNSEDRSILVLSGFPEDDRFLYESDGQGNERTHIFLRQVNGVIRDLTPSSEAKCVFKGWSSDQKSFFYLTNDRDPKFFDLYEIDIETFTAKLLYQNDHGYKFCAISSDKSYIALNKVVSETHVELYLYDLNGHFLRNLPPQEKNSRRIGIEFSPNSKELYFLSNEDSEFTYLKKFNIDAGNVELVEKDAWDIFFCSFSLHGRYRATAINEDGKTIIKIYDQHTNKQLKLPKIPEGTISNVVFSRSEKYMLFYVDSSHAPSDLYLYNLEEESVRRLTNSLNPEINPYDLVDPQNVRYSSYDGMLIPALFYKPRGIKEGEKIPALVWVHGGPGGQSRKEYHYLIQFLVNHGYAILAVNNRGSNGYGKTFYSAADLKHGEADLDDCIWAKKFLSNTGFVDENRVGIIGGSYGGYIALAALAFRPQEMAVGVDLFGVSNWIRTLKNIPSWWESEREALYKKIGNPETDVPYLKSISPLFHAHNIVKPILVLQGANDPRVLRMESDQMVEAIGKKGIPHRYIIFDDEGHGFVKKHNKLIAAQAILDFLNEHLEPVPKP